MLHPDQREVNPDQREVNPGLREVNPDLRGDQQGVTAQFQALQEAKETLLDKVGWREGQ